MIPSRKRTTKASAGVKPSKSPSEIVVLSQTPVKARPAAKRRRAASFDDDDSEDEPDLDEDLPASQRPKRVATQKRQVKYVVRHTLLYFVTSRIHIAYAKWRLCLQTLLSAGFSHAKNKWERGRRSLFGEQSRNYDAITVYLCYPFICHIINDPHIHTHRSQQARLRRRRRTQRMMTTRRAQNPRRRKSQRRRRRCRRNPNRPRVSYAYY